MKSCMKNEEPSFEHISGLYARPRTKRLLINGPVDYKIIEVRPDFTMIMKDATLKSKQSRIGFGFAEGEVPKLFNFNDTSQKLLDDYIPIVISKVKKNNLEYKQVAFTADNNGRRNIYIRLSIKNLHPCAKQNAILWFTVIQKEHDELYEISNEDYLPYQTLQAPWFEGVPLSCCENCLLQDENIVISYKVAEEISVQYINNMGHGSNMLKFSTELSCGETREIDIVIPYEGLSYIEPEDGHQEAISIRLKNRYPISQKNELNSYTFDNLLANTVSQWEEILSRSTRIEVPEAAIQKVYNTLSLNNHQLLAHPPEKPFSICGQGGCNDYGLVYGWESSFLLNAMDSQNFHKEVRKVLEYFLAIQDNSKGPEGDIHSSEGTFRPSIHWMCETGAILKVFGMHYWLTKDKEWLAAVSPKLIKACKWIADERKSTKQFNETGTQVNHYGLLPKGRVHDWPDRGYFFFSDTYTCEGLKIVADALADIGHPEGSLWQNEAEDYRICILNAVENATYTNPLDKHNIFIANEVYGTSENIMTSYGLDGPACLLATNIIEPSDERVPLIELGLRQLGVMNDLFAVKLYKMEDEGLEQLLLKKSNNKYDLYYVNGAEYIWHKVWIERGELDKALNYFYSTIAFSTTFDTGYCNERFCPQMPWLVPWQPNGSGNGRIISMIHQALFYEKDGCLNILAGSPASWLKPGNRIEVRNGLTVSGQLSFAIECDVEKKDGRYYNIKASFSLSKENRIQSILVALRLPMPGKLIKALIQKEGDIEFKKAVIGNDSIIVHSPVDRFILMCTWDTLDKLEA